MPRTTIRPHAWSYCRVLWKRLEALFLMSEVPMQVVVTGGNTGLGKQTCIRLAAMGADVILASRT